MMPAAMPAARLLLVGVILLPGLALGCARDAPPADDPLPPAAPVKWMEARQLFIEEWTEVVGTTQPPPQRSARVTAAVEGIVVSILGEGTGKPLVEGQHVEKGAVLVRLDDRVARANHDKVVADQEDLAQQIKQAGLTVRLADIDLRRNEKLRAGGDNSGRLLVSPVELDRARVAVEDAQSKQAGAELRYQAGQKQLKALEEQLRLYTLTAPIAGRLGRLFVVTGQTLAVGTTVAEIVDLDQEIDLLAFVPPYTARKLTLGQTVRLGALGDNAASAKGTDLGGAAGKVVFIGGQSELDTGNFPIKARFPNAGRGLRGNLTLRARVLTVSGKACLTLPESALMEDQDPPAVIIVEDYKQGKNKDGKDEETGKARKLRVQVGIRDRVLHVVEILGLEDPEKKWNGSLETTKFVTERGQGLRNGDPIRLEADDEDEAAAPADEKKADKP